MIGAVVVACLVGIGRAAGLESLRDIHGGVGAAAATVFDSLDSSSDSHTLPENYRVCFIILGVVFAVLSAICGFFYGRSMYQSRHPLFNIQKSYTLLLVCASIGLLLSAHLVVQRLC